MVGEISPLSTDNRTATFKHKTLFTLSGLNHLILETHLTHELGYDPVEHGALVSEAMFPGAQSLKVGCKNGDVLERCELN